MKYGFGVNLEQELPHHWRRFARWGWNEGQHESYAYTEVDQTVEVGADLAGNAWRRQHDKIGGVLFQTASRPTTSITSPWVEWDSCSATVR